MSDSKQDKYVCSVNKLSQACSTLLLGVTFLVAPVLFNNVVVLSGVSVGISAVQAQESAPVKKRALPTISDKIFKGREKVYGIISPDTKADPNAKPNYPLGLKETKKLESRCKDCSGADLAEIYQLYGNIYYNLEKPLESLKFYKKVAAQTPNISVGMELQTLTTVTQLSIQEEKYGDALKYLEKKLALTKEQGLEVVADDFYLKSIICYYDNKTKCALDSINTAVRMVEGRGSVAKEAWYGVQRSMYYETENFKGALGSMVKLVRHYPKKKYWRELSSFYGLLEREKDQLFAMDAAYVMGALDKENQLMALAQAYINQDVPYLSAKIIEKGLKDKTIKPTEDNLLFLARLWRLSKEPKKAISVAKQQGKISKSGDAYGTLVRSYLDLNNPKEAIKWGEQALKKGKFSKGTAGLVYSDLGSAYFELRQFDKAVATFKKAAGIARYKKTAESWIGYVENEKIRYEGLKQSLADVGVDIEEVLN